MTLHPSVAAVRRGVREVLALREPGDTVLVACSGGPDSLALLSATVFEARAHALRVVGVTIDHGLQEGSADQAAAVVEQMAAMGADETASVRVHVAASRHGVEASARHARYEVLEDLNGHFGGSVVLLGHTRDDQAETVLLGLARGSGGRSLAGMRRTFRCYARPLLDVARDDTVTACQVEGLAYWDDPHNHDPGFTRVRVRRRVLPVVEEALGPGVAAALARTAEQLREDVDTLDDIADKAYADLRTSVGLPVDRLLQHPPAVLSRLVRRGALDAGASDGELTHGHVRALVDLVRGDLRGEVQLPGHLTALLDRGDVVFRRT